jgi:hypothetical protein
LASDVAVDDLVDGLVDSAFAAGLAPQPAGDLLRRSGLLQTGEAAPH